MKVNIASATKSSVWLRTLRHSASVFISFFRSARCKDAAERRYDRGDDDERDDPEGRRFSDLQAAESRADRCKS